MQVHVCVYGCRGLCVYVFHVYVGYAFLKLELGKNEGNIMPAAELVLYPSLSALCLYFSWTLKCSNKKINAKTGSSGCLGLGELGVGWGYRKTINA